jgi:hypothetical protein
VQPDTSPQAISDSDGVNLLIEMSDDVVRQKVGEAFVAQMQNSGRVQSTFFPGASGLLAPLPPELNDWVGQVASSLIALSLAQCSSYGFSATVDRGRAQTFLNNNLSPSNANFTKLAMSTYQALFPTYCAPSNATSNTTFDTFLGGDSAPRWGTLLADHLSSPAYINQEMIKLNPAVDSGGWYQVLYANFYKVQCLNSAEINRVLNAWDQQVQGVLNSWNQQLQGKQAPGQVTPWNVYDHMVASIYSDSTFMPQVHVAINTPTRTSYLVQGWPETSTSYGDAVNNWLFTNYGLGGFITGHTDMNSE